MNLVEATTAIVHGKITAAIDHLLAAWREVRAPELADAIDRATRLLPAYDRPLAATTAKLEAAWFDALATHGVAAMPQLLQYLNVGRVTQVERRLAELAALPDDPRIAMRLVELASAPDIHANQNTYWSGLYELVARIRDVRTCEPLSRHLADFAYTDHPPHRHAKRAVGDLVRTPPNPPRLDATQTAELARVLAALDFAEHVHTRTERDLLDAIAENRTDDAPYEVYADWLHEREHPRARLIQLACKPDRTNAESSLYVRLEELPYVFGYLYDLARRPVLDRGLPRELIASQNAGTVTWRTAMTVPLMSLVETIRFSAVVPQRGLQLPSNDDFAAFLLHPNLERLHTVHDVPIALAGPCASRISDEFEVREALRAGDVLVATLHRR